MILLIFFGVGVSWCILFSINSYLYVSCSGSITSVWEDRLSFTFKYVASGCLGWAGLFYCGTP